MEAWTIVQCVSSVVQLVDFSAKCISKANEIQQSANDALESNIAIETAASHLNQLTTEVDSTLTTVDDLSLYQLCAGPSAWNRHIKISDFLFTVSTIARIRYGIYYHVAALIGLLSLQLSNGLTVRIYPPGRANPIPVLPISVSLANWV